VAAVFEVAYGPDIGVEEKIWAGNVGPEIATADRGAAV